MKRRDFRVPMAGFWVPVKWKRMPKDWGLWEGGTVYIDPESTEAQAEEILMHELIHAAASALGWKLPESKVRPLSLYLHQALGRHMRSRNLWRRRRG